MKRLVQVLTASSLLLFAEAAISDAKVDAETLLNSALPFAEKMLSEHGEFYPFGEAMKPDGQIVSVGAAGESVTLYAPFGQKGDGDIF